MFVSVFLSVIYELIPYISELIFVVWTVETTNKQNKYQNETYLKCHRRITIRIQSIRHRQAIMYSIIMRSDWIKLNKTKSKRRNVIWLRNYHSWNLNIWWRSSVLFLAYAFCLHTNGLKYSFFQLQK